MEKGAEDVSDRDLRDRILGGVQAFSVLQDRFRRKLESYLVGHCRQSDGRSREKAVEIASQVLADCFSRSPSLLDKWRGTDNLEAFLRTVALNRLKTWWDSRDAAVEVDSESRSITEAAASGGTAAVDLEELKYLQEALTAGVDAALVKSPEGVLFMRLKGLHAVDQRVLSAIWGHHESQTSRRISEAMQLIRSHATSVALDSGVRPDMHTLQRALQGNPSILLGNASASVEPPDAELLRQLANGGMERDDRDRAVVLMCENARALDYFARLLKRKDEPGATWIRDPALDGVGARIADSNRRVIEVLRPDELRELISPLMSDLFGDALRSIGADGGTLWWLSPGEAVLVAVFNPLEPEIVDKRQPLVSGLISLVIATSEIVRVEAADSHNSHSPAIDALLDKTTRSMIAVPFKLLDETRGVLTAVRLKSAEPFRAADTEIIGRQARALEALLTAALNEKITGLADR